MNGRDGRCRLFFKTGRNSIIKKKKGKKKLGWRKKIERYWHEREGQEFMEEKEEEVENYANVNGRKRPRNIVRWDEDRRERAQDKERSERQKMNRTWKAWIQGEKTKLQPERKK